MNDITTTIRKHKEIEDLNNYLTNKTRILNFFENQKSLENFTKFIKEFSKEKPRVIDYGDFQTPIALCDKICKYLRNNNINPEILLEPTCGEGNFVISALKYFPSLKYVYCVDVQPKYEWFFKLNLYNYSLENDINCTIEFHRDNIFDHKYSTSFLEILKECDKQFLIIGNPPWITNTELSKLSSWNLPEKYNIKKINGLEAITGSSNFDIAEYIIVALIKQFSFRSGIIAQLCKTVVSKNIVRDIHNLELSLSKMKSLVIDSKKEFNVSADASLFIANFGGEHEEYSEVYSIYRPSEKIKSFGWYINNFISNLDDYKNYNYIDGKSPLEWRQGVKHDANKIFILDLVGENILQNGYNKEVIIEDNLLYPFVKGSELRDLVVDNTNKKIIITQKNLNEDTRLIETKYPRTWEYLKKYEEELDSRKSKIYDGKPKFSMFGIGGYTFKPYKIGIAGFYKDPIFSLILPIDEKPIILDDTSYQLSFDNLNDVFFTWLIFNTTKIKKFLLSIAFIDSKRPFTKRILQRVNFVNLLSKLKFKSILNLYNQELSTAFDYKFNEQDFNIYIKKFLRDKPSNSLERFL
ncbi:MAG: hypothetical protein ACFFCE_01260 [Promethearchaeota archaeon]